MDHINAARIDFGAAFHSPGATEYQKLIANGLGQLASAIGELVERQQRIEFRVANLGG
jgi:hypothetical protein